MSEQNKSQYPSYPHAYWSFFLIVSFFSIALVTIAFKSYTANEQHFIYPLDDPYIHMSIAKNFALYGNFGVTSARFSSSSSSVLWTFLLASWYSLFGISEVLPFLLNVIAAIWCLWYVFRFGQQYHLHPIHNFITQGMFLLVTPLIPVIFTGMEHTLHILLILMLAFHTIEIFSKNGECSKTTGIVLLVISPCAVMVRYESLFFLTVIIVMLFAVQRYQLGLGLLIGSISPVVIFGIFSLLHGSYFLPNSLMIKGSFPHMNSLKDIVYSAGYAAIKKLATHDTHLFVMIVAILLMYLWHAKKVSSTNSKQSFLLIVVATTLLHVQFADTGWFFRYEAYIMALGIVAFNISLPRIVKEEFKTLYPIKVKRIPQLSALVLLIILSSLPLTSRAAIAIRSILPATQNIYEQQYQMGKFLKTYYYGASIAANDIGAITFLSDIDYLLDFWGIGTIEIMQSAERKTDLTPLIEQLSKTHQIRLAIVYENYLKHMLPKEWIKVGSWKIQHNVICGGDTVTFFATSHDEIIYLLRALRNFSGELPESIHESGLYTGDWHLISEIKQFFISRFQ